MPTLNDDVYITLPGEYGVTVSSATAMAQSLTLGRDCQSMDCHSLSKPSLTLRNHLTVNGNFIARSQSYVRYEYSTSLNMQITVNEDLQNLALMSVNARVTFTGTGNIINSGVFKVERQSSSWTNVFNVNFTNHGILDFESPSSDTTFNAVLHNEMSGIVVINGQNVRDGTINNTGVIVMRNTGTRTISSRLLNYGQIQIQMGTLAVTGALENSGSIEITGILRCSALTVLNERGSVINGDVIQLIQGTHDLQGGTFGVRLITMQSSAVVTVTAYVELQRLEVLGGTVRIMADTFAVAVLFFQQGTITGNGNTLESNHVIIPSDQRGKSIYNTTLAISERFTVQASSQTLYVYMYTDSMVNMLEGSTFWVGSEERLFLDQRDSSGCVITVHGRMKVSGYLQTDMAFILNNGDLSVVGTGQLILSGPASFSTSRVFVSRHATLWLNGGSSTPNVNFSTGTHIHNDGHIRTSSSVSVSSDSTVSPTFGQISCDVNGRFEISSSSSGLSFIRQMTTRDSCEFVVTDEDENDNPLHVETVILYNGGSLRLNTDVAVEHLTFTTACCNSRYFYLNENHTYSVVKELKIAGSWGQSFVGVGSTQSTINVIGRFTSDDNPTLYVQSAVMRLHSSSYFIQGTDLYLQSNGILEVMSTSRLLIIDSYIYVTTAGTLQNHGFVTVAGTQSHVYTNLINDGTILLSRGELHVRGSSSNLGVINVAENAALQFHGGQHVFHPGSSLACHQGNNI